MKRYIWIAFMPFMASAQSFIDVDIYSPYATAIESMAERGIIEGYDTGVYREFKPNQTVNRAEALKILFETTQLPAPVVTVPITTFSDINPTDWYGPYVLSALDRKIIQGYEDNTFRPANEVTRAELMVLLSKTFLVPIPETINNQEWWEPYIDFGLDKNVLPAEADPHAALTRGEVAEMVYRFEVLTNIDFVKPYSLTGVGLASYYAPSLAGNTTAFGEVYDPQALTVAHRTLPYNTKMKLTRGDKSIIVRVNDRGPFIDGRVLDLSEIVFKGLGDLSEGVIEVQYEVIVDAENTQQAIPDDILGVLERESATYDIPDSIEEKLDEQDVSLTATNMDDFNVAIAEKRSISYISQDYYENLELRSQFPKTVQVGSVIELLGRANDYGYERVRVFLQPIIAGSSGRGEQIHFEGVLSGKNFVIPIAFLEEGTYAMGIVFDDQITSTVVNIEVVPEWDINYPPVGDQYDSKLSASIDPNIAEVTFSWTPQGADVITKIVATDGFETRQVVMEALLFETKIPLDFFTPFNNSPEVTLTLHHARSADGTWHGQNGAWRRSEKKTYTVLPTYTPKRTEYVRENTIPRYHEPFKTITITGTVDENTTLAPTAFVMQPSGLVESPLLNRTGNEWSMDVEVTAPGTYVVQIVNSGGMTLWAETFYARFDDKWVLPVVPWPTEEVEEVIAQSNLLSWANKLRADHNKSALTPNATLSTFAQEFADEMSRFQFISHTDTDGNSFGERIKIFGLSGRLGENVAFGSNLEAALNSLELSPSHRKNLLDGDWNYVGLGVSKNEQGDVYVAFIFGERIPDISQE